MKTPPFLNIGDRVGVVAPARKVSPPELEAAIQLLEKWGLKVETGKHLYKSLNQFSGTDIERTQDLQYMLDNDSVKAVFCARGGYGTVRLIDKLDFSGFRLSPKWIVGFSDITVLHAHINQVCQVETLHAPMLINLASDNCSAEALEALKNTLFGKPLSYRLEPHPLNKKGDVRGPLVGGNLSVIYSIMGSNSEINTNGKILFLEDLDEYLYHIDRMMMCLKRAGKFDNLVALVVGSMSKMNDNLVPFGKTPYEIIADVISDYPFPVCFNVPAGHITDNRALIMGRNVKLLIDSNVTIDFGS